MKIYFVQQSMYKKLSQESIRFSPDKLAPDLSLEGVLSIPKNPIGLVIFAHGSGSGKNSNRNQIIANKLNENNIATFLFDLLSKEEQESDRRIERIISQLPGTILNKFNIQLLSKRLMTATDWLSDVQKMKGLHLAYFGSSTGAAAALISASLNNISSVVIRSGRTDLVGNEILSNIFAPCLFITGDREKIVIKIAKQTMKKLGNASDKKLTIVENSSHLLDESGSLEKVAEITNDWILTHFQQNSV